MNKLTLILASLTLLACSSVRYPDKQIYGNDTPTCEDRKQFQIQVSNVNSVGASVRYLTFSSGKSNGIIEVDDCNIGENLAISPSSLSGTLEYCAPKYNGPNKFLTIKMEASEVLLKCPVVNVYFAN